MHEKPPIYNASTEREKEIVIIDKVRFANCGVKIIGGICQMGGKGGANLHEKDWSKLLRQIPMVATL